MKKRAALHNLGCKVNEFETEAMRELLEKAGYEIVPFEPGADVYVINTCTVTNIADRKSRQMLHKARKMNPAAIVAAAGCYAQTDAQSLEKDDAVDLIIGNNRKKDIAVLLEEFERSRVRKTEVPEIGKTREFEPLSLERTTERVRAFVKVQDGCNQFCSYCIIPYARGRVRSRSIPDILEEIGRLAETGCKEVVLTGIHLSSYGADFREGHPEDLLSLIRAVHEVPGIERIRLGSLEPMIITEDFAAALSGLPKICPHFHLSLQSGCDATLKRMNRRYTTEDFRRICGILRKHFDDPALTTDIIVGFPMETEEEFAASRAFAEEMRFYETHVFQYSRRRGTRAAAMEGQVPETVKKERSEILLRLNEQRREEFEKRRTGKRLSVLLEEKILVNGNEYLTGHSMEYVKTAIPAEGPYQENDIVNLNAERFLCKNLLTGSVVF